MEGSSLSQLRAFFDLRSSEIFPAEIGLAALCHASGRDYRLWRDDGLFDELIASVRAQMEMAASMSLLEVGCAAGFLARGLSRICAHYTGVDISPAAVRCARRLALPSSEFRVADATALPFSDGKFDRAISYDVFTNFSDLDLAVRVTREMLRVVRKGGKVMIGSLADKALEAEHATVVDRVSSDLDRRFGPNQTPAIRPGLLDRLRLWYERQVLRIEPRIMCYAFRREDFEALGREAGVETRIEDIHPSNPYRGFRFNVIYTKNSGA